MIVYDAQQKPIELGQSIGTGGEATVYQVANKPGLLAKIYLGHPRPGYNKKLAWMQHHPPNDPTKSQNHASIAWPLELLYTNRRKLVGYLMPYIHNAVHLLDVFNPRRREITLPGFHQLYLHRTARNLATALAAIHHNNYIVGDLNESNVMVTPSALVTLIDTDSFQIKTGSDLYPCPVGKPEYTPPELQGQSFADTQRLPEHDCFGLAILTFQLLMNGNHPFRAQWLNSGEPPPIEERIRQGCFPYVDKPNCPVAPPRHSPTLEALHPGLAELFRQCFVDGHSNPRQRPSAATWARALAEAETALIPCKNGHYYAKQLPSCPDCQTQRRRQRTASAIAAARRQKTIELEAANAAAVPVAAQENKTNWQRWIWPLGGAIILLLGVLVYNLIFLVGGNNTAQLQAESRPPTATPYPTPAQLVRVVLPTKTPTVTATPTNTPSPVPSPTYTYTPSPVPPPVNTPLPEAPPSSPSNNEPEVAIILPDGNTYNRGDTIKVILSFKDPDGVGNVFWWITGNSSENILLRKNHWCGNNPECTLTEEFTDLSPGIFNIFVAAFDTLENSTVKDTQVIVQ